METYLAIPGVLFSSTWDGRLQAISTREGKVIWEFDTSKEFQTMVSKPTAVRPATRGRR